MLNIKPWAYKLRIIKKYKFKIRNNNEKMIEELIEMARHIAYTKLT
jgi:hypothetical protein